MEKLERYRSVIERELTSIVEQTKGAISAPPGLRDKTVFDRQSDYYLILREGWDSSRRIHGPVVSLEIIDGKVWLQADNTDLRVAERLEEAGIPQTANLLSFQTTPLSPATQDGT